MSCEEEDEGAVAKAWRTPEVVEKFLDFLDGRSIVRLARCHDLTKETLRVAQGGQEGLPCEDESSLGRGSICSNK